MTAAARLVFGTVDLPDTGIAPRLLDRFRADGGRSLDVANVYRDGESARAVGKWLAGRSAAGEMVVYAKGCHPPSCHPSLVGAEVEEALRLLGLDRLDAFLLHRDDTSVPVAQWAEVLLAQVERGRIGAFGVSNWTMTRLMELREHLAPGDRDALVALSNHFSLAHMVSPPWAGCLAVSREDLAELAAANVTLLAWSSLGTGFFAGRDTPHWDSAENRRRRDRAQALGEELDSSGPAVALAYVLHQPGDVRPVVGTRSEQHLDDALAAVSLELIPEQLAWLECGVPVAV